MTTCHLADYLESSAARCPDRVAVVDPDGHSLTYAELDRRATAIARLLAASGVERGDRVGVVLPKSSTAVAALFGIMKAGAAAVPVDCTAPAERIHAILADCEVRALFVDSQRAEELAGPLESRLAATIVVSRTGESALVESVPVAGGLQASGSVSLPTTRTTADLAYILYTSGSTGIPKGVMLTHENASSFVEWCSSVFSPVEDDRFSSHAPFHFDLSVLDIYVSIKHGASVYLISEALGKNPKDLARFIAASKVTVWYSTPSILMLLLQHGNLQAHDVASLRLVLFAGEVFPVKHLRALQRLWPAPVYYNLYGPTETNVCTFARIPDWISDDRELPFPIGFPCAHCRALVLDERASTVPSGREGLLYISGASVFSGYWNRPSENAAAFQVREGVRWYNTGDVVRWDDAEGYTYLGRRDRMVKRRGYRIELGEIERALYTHPEVRETAAIAVPDPEMGVRIVAFLATHGGPGPSIVELKTFCAHHLPAYMSPDRFVRLDRLPKTSTDKVDYRSLRQSVVESNLTAV